MMGTLHEDDVVEGYGPEVETGPYVLMRLHARWYAVHAMSVLKVVVKGSVARVPGHEAHILGLAQVRDTLIPVMDLAALTKTTATTVTTMTLPRMVIIGTLEHAVGVIADEARGIEQLPLPSVSHEGGIISASAQIGGREISYLAVDRLMAMATSESQGVTA